MEKIDLKTLREKCPLPVLLHQMGLGEYAKASCRSPLRKDKNPSWGLYERQGFYYWHDFATDDGGDEITFLARHYKLDEKHDFPRILEKYAKIAKKVKGKPDIKLPAKESRKPHRSGFGMGTCEQLEELSNARGFSVESLKLAQEKGWLVFGNWYGNEVYGLTDSSGQVLELRRLDGKMFPAVGAFSERKSHAVKGSRKNWPVGVLDIKDHACVALVEGVPDFLAAVDIIRSEGKLDRVAPVAILSATSSIAQEALVQFRGKHVRIFPHADQAGVKGAARWKDQLQKAGVAKVDFFDLSSGGAGVKDLCDYWSHQIGETAKQSTAEVMP